MFGFLGSPCRSCASNRVQTTYRQFFCGLSGALRDDYSPAARFLVNRDSTFLSLLLASINPARPEPSIRTCCQPIAEPRPLFSHGLHSRYAAAVTVCGLAVKLDDDGKDEKGLRRMLAKLLGKTVSPATDKATSFLNSVQFPTNEVVEALKEQETVESNQPDLYQSAEPTAQAYGTIFRHGAAVVDQPDQSSRLETLGRSLGRLIYWRDAYDDLEEDQRRSRFNPLTNSSLTELNTEFGKELEKLKTTSSLKGHFHETIDDVMAVTVSKHRALVPEGTLAMPMAEKSSKKKKKKEEKSCADRCDCMADCCPADCSCCDCDCSP